MGTNNLCFELETIEIVYPFSSLFYYIKLGLRWYNVMDMFAYDPHLTRIRNSLHTNTLVEISP